MKFLNTTKFIHANKKAIFFLEEKNGFLGKLDIESGKVLFYKNTPAELLGRESYDVVSIVDHDDIYILYGDGEKISKFNCLSELFDEDVYNQLSGDEKNDSWAGGVNYDKYLYFFARDNGKYLKYDIENKTTSFHKIEIKDKIMWVCNAGSKVFLLSWGCDKLYMYDLQRNHLNETTIDLDSYINSSDKSIMSIHTMYYWQECIYFLDKKNLYKMKLDNLRVELLYASFKQDNGTRIKTIQQKIIIPPYDGDEFLVIDIDSGTVFEVIDFPDDVNYEERGGASKVGVPCENGDLAFFPLIASDKYVTVNKETLEFTFKNIKFDKENIRGILSNVVQKNKIIKENITVQLENFIESIL